MLEALKRRARRLLNNTELQRAISWANGTSQRVRSQLAEAKRALADTLTVEGHDDLETLKRELDEMTERGEKKPDGQP
jgi:hypothetical protein